MKIISIIFILVISMEVNSDQSKPKKVINGFVNDLRENNVSNPDLLKKYFLFVKDISQQEKKEEVFTLIDNKINFLRKTLSDCSGVKIIKHDDQLDMVKSYKLKYSNYDKVYYITCNNSIVTPVLVDENKIVSIWTYTKTNDGTKGFMLF